MQYRLSIVSLFLSTGVMGYLVPNLPGKYNVTLTTGALIDNSRDGRALMVSVFEPTECSATKAVPYMPNKTAEYQGQFLQDRFTIPMDLSPLFLEAELSVCSDRKPDDCSNPENEFPILLLGPGWSIPRLYYSVIASNIASQGFVVVSMDHPNETNIITYPDGHAVITNASEPENIDGFLPYLPPRVADTLFVIDQLQNATAVGELLPHRGQRAFTTEKIAMMGHSLGGVTAVFAAAEDCRIRGAIDLDQFLFGPALPKNLSIPVLFMFRPNGAEANWLDAWQPQLTGPTLWIEINGTTHQSYSDAMSLLQAAGEDISQLADLLGSIKPDQIMEIITEYATEWLNGAFDGKIEGPLFVGNEQEKYPEVTTVSKSGF